MAAYITVGAKTTHGGEVITGSPYTTHNGVQVSRKGDKVICKKCKKLTTILTGDPSFIVDGAPIAREGDVTSCGAKLIAIQHSFAESDFEVFGVEQPEPLFEQPAPLKFPKTDPDALIDSFINTVKEDSSNETNAWANNDSESALQDQSLSASFNGKDSVEEYTATEKKVIQDAVIEQNRMLNDTKNRLTRWNSDDQEEFVEAFGEVNNLEKARKEKLSQVNRMLDLNESLTLDNFKDVRNSSKALGGGYVASDPHVGAYVIKNDTTHQINTGKAFFEDPFTGKPTSKSTNARLLTHEFSHFNDIAGTNDLFNDIRNGEFYNNGKSIYGTTASKELAKNRPDLALKHADSFSYYASGMVKNSY